MREQEPDRENHRESNGDAPRDVDPAKPGGEREKHDGILHGAMRRIMASPYMPHWVAVLSFLENTIIFYAVEPLLIAVMVARRKQAYLLAAMLLLGSVAGAATMYLLGSLAFQTLITPLLEQGDLGAEFAQLEERVNNGGFVALYLLGIMPVPYQLVTTAAGVLNMPFLPFLVVVTLSRATRYFGLAVIISELGRPAQRLLESNQGKIALAGLSLFFLLILLWVLF